MLSAQWYEGAVRRAVLSKTAALAYRCGGSTRWPEEQASCFPFNCDCERRREHQNAVIILGLSIFQQQDFAIRDTVWRLRRTQGDLLERAAGVQGRQ